MEIWTTERRNVRTSSGRRARADYFYFRHVIIAIVLWIRTEGEGDVLRGVGIVSTRRNGNDRCTEVNG